jgi:hemoglobin-like flavoprotein
MTEEQIVIIRQSWEKVKPGARQIGRSLYDKLFVALPHVRHMFDEDINQQACKLAAVVSFVVAKLHRLEDIFPDLKSIGSKHEKYNIPLAWYDVVGQCLIDAIKEESRDSWNDHIGDTWLTLYNILKEQMLLGQQ